MTSPRGGLVRLSVAGFLAYASYAICRAPLLPLFASDLGASPPMVGLIVGVSTFTGVLLKLPAGAWSDVLGRRTLLVAGGIVFAVLPFTYLAVSGLGALIVLRLLHGSATAIFGPVASASVSDLAPPERRGTWLSTYLTVQGVGQAAGPIVAGYLIARGRFDVAFLLAGLLALAVPAIVATWPQQTQRTPSTRRWQQFAGGIREVLRQRLVLVTSAAQAAQFILHGTLSAFLPLYARETLGLSALQIGWLFGLQTITTLCTRPIIGMASDRIGRRGVIAVGLLFCAGGVLLVSTASTFGAALFSVCVYAVGVAVTNSAASAYITDLTQRTTYGAAHGVFGTIYDIGDVAGPIFGGMLVAAFGYERTFQTMAAIVVIAAAFFFAATKPRPTRRSASAKRPSAVPDPGLPSARPPDRR
jgi:MFS transporter, DHA1 family, multidrug resistance protein